MTLDDWEAVPDTAFAWAWREAEERKAQAEEARRAAAEALAAELAEVRIYDPFPYIDAAPQDTRMYEGTGIGCLYGLPGSERFLPELGDWVVVSRSTQRTVVRSNLNAEEGE